MASGHVPAKISDRRRLTGFTSDYVFIRYAGTDELKKYDWLDFGLFGSSWVPIISWAVVFVPGVNESNWRDYLPPPNSDTWDTRDFLYVVASGSTNGIFRNVDKDGVYKKGSHGVRTVVRLNELNLDSRATSDAGGSLFLKIDLVDQDRSDNVTIVDTKNTFDGQVYWSLYWK